MLEPSWWLVAAGFLLGHFGGFAVASILGVVKAAKEDTDWHLAELIRKEEVPK